MITKCSVDKWQMKCKTGELWDFITEVIGNETTMELRENYILTNIYG